MIRLDNNGGSAAANRYEKTNHIISAVKTGGTIAMAVLTVAGFAVKKGPELIKKRKKK